MRGSPLSRRELLAGASALILSACTGARAMTVQGALPWSADAGAWPVPVQPGPWQYFTPEEGATVEAIVDRLIPPDATYAGGKDAGCAVFIDRQLAGAYGRAQGHYSNPPFLDPLPTQGDQNPLTPAQQYRAGLAALARHVKAAFAGKTFRELTQAQQDDLLGAMEKGSLKLEGADAQKLFSLVLENTMEGFFADPVYGGNRDMVGWRMVGFPGARYDYRDWIDQHNKPYPRPPVGITGRPAWAHA